MEENKDFFTNKIVEKRSINNISKKEQKELFDKRENNYFHFVKIALILVFGICILAISITLVLHLILPNDYRWLCKEEVASLEKLFVTGIGAGLLGKFGNKLTE